MGHCNPPAKEGIFWLRVMLIKKVAEGGYIMLNQFANEDNWKAHYKTTGPEIWNDTEGTCNAFVAGWERLNDYGNLYLFEEKNPNIKSVGDNQVMVHKLPD
jgi:cysteine synthase B